MSKLVIVRHAQAIASATSDHDRELTEIGIEQARALGQWLIEQKISFDHAVVSDSVRTRQTFDLLEVDCPVTLSPAAYNARAGALAQLVREVPTDAQCVLLVAHNPGAFDLASAYGYYADMTPGSAAVCELIGSPSEFGNLHATVTASFQPPANQ